MRLDVRIAKIISRIHSTQELPKVVSAVFSLKEGQHLLGAYHDWECRETI